MNVEPTFRNRLPQTESIITLESPSYTIYEGITTASNGIKDKVAIISIGCTPFKEHWDKSADDLLIDATTQTLQAVDMTTEDIDAYWVGTAQSGMSD